VISGSSGIPEKVRGGQLAADRAAPAFFFDKRVSKKNAERLRAGGDGLAGGPPLEFGQPVVLLQPPTGQAGAADQVGTGLPHLTRLETDLGSLAHETS
jgi:hypothetical protein